MSFAAFYFGVACWPGVAGFGGVGAGEVLGLSGWSEVGVVGDLAVAREGFEDFSDEGAFEAAVDGCECLASGEVAVAVVAGTLVLGHADFDRLVQCPVGLPVASAGEAVALGFAGGDGDGAGAAEGSEGCLAA